MLSIQSRLPLASALIVAAMAASASVAGAVTIASFNASSSAYVELAALTDLEGTPVEGPVSDYLSRNQGSSAGVVDSYVEAWDENGDYVDDPSEIGNAGSDYGSAYGEIYDPKYNTIAYGEGSLFLTDSWYNISPIDLKLTLNVVYDLFSEAISGKDSAEASSSAYYWFDYYGDSLRVSADSGSRPIDTASGTSSFELVIPYEERRDYYYEIWAGGSSSNVIAPVPLPMTAPLLVAGLSLLAAARSARRTRHARGLEQRARIGVSIIRAPRIL